MLLNYEILFPTPRRFRSMSFLVNELILKLIFLHDLLETELEASLFQMKILVQSFNEFGANLRVFTVLSFQFLSESKHLPFFLLFSFMKLVNIFSINPHLGPLQISLGRMIIDIMKFFFVYTLVLFAFGCGKYNFYSRT